MNVELRQRLVEAAKDVQMREILTYLYPSTRRPRACPGMNGPSVRGSAPRADKTGATGLPVGLHRDHPQGASFAALKEMLFLHEAFDEARLRTLAEVQILMFDGTRYKIAADARQILDRDPVILMDEFLRE